jgi:3-hydroxyisobutyrate dehydrogenase-like beta-hydroxyacid dehydrogenase
MEKDLALAASLVAAHEVVPEPLASALAFYRRTQAEGRGNLDYSAIAICMGAAE